MMIRADGLFVALSRRDRFDRLGPEASSGRVSPERFEIVKIANLFVEDVHYHVAVIDQNF